VISSQYDFPATILSQLNLGNDEFEWSKNLFNPYSKEFAFYEINNGLGWVSTKGSFAYDNQINKYFFKELDTITADSIIRDGKAYLQVLFDEFIGF
jgi:hypothetical protein